MIRRFTAVRAAHEIMDAAFASEDPYQALVEAAERVHEYRMALAGRERSKADDLWHHLTGAAGAMSRVQALTS